jgi:hypothetical protein
VEKWAVPTQNEREKARRSASPKEIREFYEAIFPLMPDILGAVDEFPFGELPQEFRTLFEMACSLAEVSPHAELYNYSPLVPNAFEEERFHAGHGEERTAG